MKKRFLSMLLVILMVMSLFPMTVLAVDYIVHDPVFVQNCDLGFHHGNTNGGPSVTKGILPDGYTKKQGEAFAQTEDYGYWLLVYPAVDENGDPAYDADGKRIYLLPNSEEEGLFPEYQYICPICGRTDWVSYSNMSSGDFAKAFSGKNMQVCHYWRYDNGSLKVTADVDKEHIKETWQPYQERDVDEYYERDVDEYYERDVDEYYERDVDEYYERDVDEYYERDVDEFYERDVDEYYERDVDEYYERDVDEYFERDVDEYYERDVDEYYERDVDEFYERDVDEYYERDVDEYYERDVDEYYVRDVQDLYEKSVQDVYQRSIKDVYVPVFKKDVSYAYGTLVSGITYGYGVDGKFGLPGGYLNNGMTYLTINDIEQYTDENPLSVWIADSSPKNKKTDPTQYNKNFDYFYELYVEDGKVFVEFDDRLIEAGFGILVSDMPFKGNPTSKVKHDDNPDGAAVKADINGNTYVFFHADGISWYTTGEYEFVGWSLYDTEIGNYILVDTEYGPCEYVDTEYGYYELMDTIYGNWELMDTIYGNWELMETIYGNWELMETIYGNWELMETIYGNWELMETIYGNWELMETIYGNWGLMETIYGNWELMETIYGNWELMNTIYGNWELMETIYGNWELMETIYGNWELMETIYGNWELKETIYGNWELMDTIYGEYELILNELVNSETITDPYNVDFTLTVTGPGGYNETFTLPNNGEVIIQNLTPGEYTCVLSGDDIADQTKYATVISSQQANVDFNDLATVIGEKEIINNAPINSDRPAEKHYADREAEKYYTDREAEKHYADREAEKHYADREAEKHYADREAEKYYTDREAEKHYADREAEKHYTDREAEKHYADREAEEHYADREAEKHYADREAEKHYVDRVAEEHYADRAAEEHYANRTATRHEANNVLNPICTEGEQLPDKYLPDDILPDEYLGDPTDPFGPYAIRLN